MKTLKAFKETDITIEGEKIVITQSSDYRSNTIEIPIYLWCHFSNAVSDEIYGFKNDEQ